MYKELNKICHLILKYDILKMLTAGMMTNYGFVLNIHHNLLYKTKNGHKKEKLKQSYSFVIIKKMI